MTTQRRTTGAHANGDGAGTAAIVGIEEYYFAADRNGHPPPDLRGIAERFAGAGKS